MEFELDPPRGVHRLEIGSDPGATADALREFGEPSRFSRTDRQERDWMVSRPSGLTIFAYLGTDGRIEAIEFGAPQDTSDVVTYAGVSLFDTPAEEVLRQLRVRTPIEDSADEPGYAYTAPDLLLALWRPVVPEGLDDPDGRYFASVLLARPGYDVGS